MFHFELFDVKKRAWNTLRSCYWYAVLAFFISYVLTAIASGVMQLVMRLVGVGVAISLGDKIAAVENFLNSIPEENLEAAISAMSVTELIEVFSPLVQVWCAVVLISMVISFLMYVFANEQIMVGMRNNYIAMRSGDNSFNGIVMGFTKNYLNVAKVSALKWLYIMIGSFFFVIPGIVLNYRYMMVQFILAENPDMPAQKALSISRRLMKGNKMRMFLMQLTFMGWMLLGAMACGIGVFFVMPYYLMAETEAYCELRDQAIASGELDPAELSGIQIF